MWALQLIVYQLAVGKGKNPVGNSVSTVQNMSMNQKIKQYKGDIESSF